MASRITVASLLGTPPPAQTHLASAPNHTGSSRQEQEPHSQVFVPPRRSSSPAQHHHNPESHGNHHENPQFMETPLHQAVADILDHLGNTELAKGWAFSVLTPLSQSTATEWKEVEGPIIKNLRNVVTRLLRRRLNNSATPLFFFSGGFPPAEMVLEACDVTLLDRVMPKSSWFRNQIAEYNLSRLEQKLLREGLAGGHPSELLKRMKIGIAALYRHRDRSVQAMWSGHEGTTNEDSPYTVAVKDFESVIMQARSVDDRKLCKILIKLMDEIREMISMLTSTRFVPPRYWYLWIPTQAWVINQAIPRLSSMQITYRASARPIRTSSEIVPHEISADFQAYDHENHDFRSPTEQITTDSHPQSFNPPLRFVPYDPTEHYCSLSRHESFGFLRKRAIYEL